MRKLFFTVAVTVPIALTSHLGAQGAEITALVAGAVQEPFEAVLHAYERESGDKVHASFGSVGTIQAKLKAGEKADLVISSTPVVAAAEKEGTVRPESRAVIGRVEIGVAVREGTAVPDIATPDSFKKALLAAKSVSYTGLGSGGTAATFVAGLLDRLGIADSVKGKALTFNAGRDVTAALAKGDSELAIGFISEFIPVKGVKIVGPLPKEIEFVNEYSAYIPATSGAAPAAGAFMAYLAKPSSRDTFKAAGVAP